MRKLTSLLILAFLTNAIPLGQVKAHQTDQNKHELKHIQKIKKMVENTGASLDREVRVKLKDRTEVRGFISEIENDHFVVKSNSGALYSISYSQVEKFSASKVNLAGKSVNGPSLFKMIGAGVSIGLGVVLVACLLNHGCMN